MKTVIPNTTTVLEAANQAAAAHLHLVIDRHGRTLLTPILLPGMQKIAVHNKQTRAARDRTTKKRKGGKA